MIKKFKDYEFDLMIESLVLESKIEFSDKFINIINQIKQNKIAKDLLSLKKDAVDADFIQNFIDTTKVKDEVTFIPDRKIKEILGKDIEPQFKVIRPDSYLTHNSRNNDIFTRLGYTIPSHVPYEPEVGTVGTIKGEVISNMSSNIYVWFVSTDGKETIINKKALVSHDDRINLLWTRNRNPIKIGRLVRSILNASKISFNDSEIEEFVNNYKSTFDIMENAFSKFKLVSGDDIAYWYSAKHYYDGGQSTLGNSCMSEVSSKYFNIYTKNTNCSLLILFSDQNPEIIDGQYTSTTIIGRSLIWKTDQDEIFMDRIYTNHDSDVELFRKYAYSKGWWCKESQNTSDNFYVTNGSGKKKAKYSVSLERSKFQYYPYVDSLSLINFDKKKISNVESLLKEANGELHSTDGDFDPINDFEAEWM